MVRDVALEVHPSEIAGRRANPLEGKGKKGIRESKKNFTKKEKEGILCKVQRRPPL